MSAADKPPKPEIPATVDSIELKAADAKIAGPNARLEGTDQKNIVWWTNANTSLQWTVNVAKPGNYRVEFNYSLFGNSNGSPLEIAVGDQKLSATPKAGDGANDYKAGDAGEVTIGKAGPLKITVKPLNKGREYVINLRSIALCPVEVTSKAIDISGTVKPSVDHSFELLPADVQMDGMNARVVGTGENGKIGYWTDVGTSLRWTINVDKPGKFRVELNYALVESEQGAKLLVSVGNEKFKVKLKAGKSWKDFKIGGVGEVDLDKPGRVQVIVTPLSKPHTAIADVRSIRLVPIGTASRAIDIGDKPIKPSAKGSLNLTPETAEIDGDSNRLEGSNKKYLAWRNSKDRLIKWPITTAKSGTYQVQLTYSLASDDSSEVEVSVGGQSLKKTLTPGSGLDDFKTESFGEITLEKVGDFDVSLSSTKEVGTLVMRLQSVTLVPGSKSE